ncbi:Zn-dependent hydrolase [Stutzerimonas stutzeri TS44]|nr:Zn-dependent hydrolase [Stutzerimonas stutzeri TS44]
MSVLRIFVWALLGLASTALAADELRFSLVRTAQTLTQGEYAWRHGDWQRPPPIDHVAVLVEHRGVRLLFGTGLGRQIDAQWDAVIPWRIKRYGAVQSVRDQLERDGLSIDRILLGCVRWEHASGLADYPEVPVFASEASLHYLRASSPPAVLPSQFVHAVRWQTLRFAPAPYQGYAQSLDLFGDGGVILVPLGRYGSVGLFLTLADGRRFFFRGDTPWRRDGAAAAPAIAASQDGLGAPGFYPQWVQ